MTEVSGSHPGMKGLSVYVSTSPGLASTLSADFLSPMPAVNEYFRLSLRLLLAFGVVFELPILMVFLARIGIVDVTFLNRHRKYAVLINFIIAAVLTPTPDIVNQLLMGVPLLILYEVSIVAVWFFGRRKLPYGPPPAGNEETNE